MDTTEPTHNQAEKETKQNEDKTAEKASGESSEIASAQTPAKRTWRPARKAKQKNIRCFFGLALRNPEVFEPLQQQLVEVASEEDKLRLSPPENLHITLAFLGSLPSSRLDETKVLGASVGSKHSPLELSCRGAGYFKNSIWVGIAEQEGLQALANDFKQAGILLGMPNDPRPFQAHITVARFAPAARQKFLPIIEKFSGQHWLDFTASKAYLYLSETRQEGPKYSILKSFVLGTEKDEASTEKEADDDSSADSSE